MALPDTTSNLQQSSLRLKIFPSLLPGLPGGGQSHEPSLIPSTTELKQGGAERAGSCFPMGFLIACHESPRLERRTANRAGWEILCVLSESRHGQALPKPSVMDLNRYPKHCCSCRSSFRPLISEPAAASLQASIIDSFQQQISTAQRARLSRGGSSAFWLPQAINLRVCSN